MSGKQVFNWREADRSEYLAGFLLSALGMAIPVERHQELVGADFYCSLADQEKGGVTFGFPFLVQVRSTVKPVVHLKAPKRYKHHPGVLPDHLAGLFRQDLPMFLALVDKEETTIRLYSLSTLRFLLHDREHCPDPAAVQLLPRLDAANQEPVGAPRQGRQVTSSPESYEYEVDLGNPVVTFSEKDTRDRALMMKQKRFLRECIAWELRNRVFHEAGLPQFWWIAGCSDDEPLTASYLREAPRDADSLRRIYGLLGPALLSLGLRYQDSERRELVGALASLFREMPSGTFPDDIRRACPDLFAEPEKEPAEQAEEPPAKRKRWHRRRRP